MNPYLVIEYRGKKYKTFTDEEGHLSPIWNETINIEIFSMLDKIKISCFDESLIFDECIGSTELMISDFVSKNNTEFKLPIEHKKKPAGTIKFLLIFSLRKNR